jgi:hypothetical protein
MFSPTLLLYCSVLLAMPGTAAPETIIELEDPPGDADGPGGYSPPSDSELSADDFDLRKFVVRVDGHDVIFEVTVGASIRAPGTPQRTNTTPTQLTNGIYYQNIDIYIDTDPTPGLGYDTCIPGRRVAFADGRTWERAVVLTPQPASARAVVEGALPDLAPFITFPGPLMVRGRTIIARVPVSRLGGRPATSWGWSVQLSGAAWERNFNLVERVKGSAAPDALTLPVLTTAERWAFGGSSGGRAHPQVVDIIVPVGADQHEILSRFNDDTVTFAAVPFVYGKPPPTTVVQTPPPRVPEALPPSDRLTVADVSNELISIQGSVAALKPMMIGAVLGPDGATAARVVVMQLVPGGLVATALDNREKILRGATVRFAATAAPQTP